MNFKTKPSTKTQTGPAASKETPKAISVDPYMEMTTLLKNKALNFKYAVPRKLAM